MIHGGYENLFKFLLKADIDAKSNSILNLYYIPFGVIDVSTIEEHPFSYTLNNRTVSGNYYTYSDTTSAYTETWSMNKVSTFPDYTPKNKKVFCYPYNYLFVTNNNGSDNIYRYEYFSGTGFSFKFEFATTIGRFTVIFHH